MRNKGIDILAHKIKPRNWQIRIAANFAWMETWTYILHFPTACPCFSLIFLVHLLGFTKISLPEAEGNVADVKPQIPGCPGANLAGASSAQLPVFLYPAVILETSIEWEGGAGSIAVYCVKKKIYHKKNKPAGQPAGDNFTDVAQPIDKICPFTKD